MKLSSNPLCTVTATCSVDVRPTRDAFVCRIIADVQMLNLPTEIMREWKNKIDAKAHNITSCYANGKMPNSGFQAKAHNPELRPVIVETQWLWHLVWLWTDERCNSCQSETLIIPFICFRRNVSIPFHLKRLIYIQNLWHSVSWHTVTKSNKRAIFRANV